MWYTNSDTYLCFLLLWQNCLWIAAGTVSVRISHGMLTLNVTSRHAQHLVLWSLTSPRIKPHWNTQLTNLLNYFDYLFLQLKPSDKTLEHNQDFRVRHYAGDVTYSIVGFIDKNKDLLFQDFKRLLFNRWDPFSMKQTIRSKAIF